MLVDATASSGLHYFRGAAELIDALRSCNIHPAVNRGKRRGMRRSANQQREPSNEDLDHPSHRDTGRAHPAGRLCGRAGVHVEMIEWPTGSAG